jgi:undecaprenyl-diphosphatase
VDPIQAIVLALVQGLTEFLPVSSSGHLILVPKFLGWPDQGLAFDVAVHMGTLAAVLVYFRQQLATLIRAWFLSVTGRPATEDSRLAWSIVIAAIPVTIVGLLASDYIEAHLRNSAYAVAAALAFFGLLLWLADRLGRRTLNESQVTWKRALVIGIAQALSLIPGTSRSGITMTAGLALGLTRTAAARFSFLLAVPSIGMAGAYEGLKLLGSNRPIDWYAMALGAAVAAVSGYLCIHYFLRLIQRVGMLPFAIYRWVLAAVVIYALK